MERRDPHREKPRPQDCAHVMRWVEDHIPHDFFERLENQNIHGIYGGPCLSRFLHYYQKR